MGATIMPKNIIKVCVMKGVDGKAHVVSKSTYPDEYLLNKISIDELTHCINYMVSKITVDPLFEIANVGEALCINEYLDENLSKEIELMNRGKL